MFSGSSLFSRVTLLNWLTKSSMFRNGFNNNELLLSLPTSFHCMLLVSVLVEQARKLLLHDEVLKGKIILQHSMQYQDSLQFCRYL